MEEAPAFARQQRKKAIMSLISAEPKDTPRVGERNPERGVETLAEAKIWLKERGIEDIECITPDLAGAFKDPNQAAETIKEIGSKLKGKKADEIVNDLFGGTKEERAAKKEQGKKLLEQFLNPR